MKKKEAKLKEKEINKKIEAQKVKKEKEANLNGKQAIIDKILGDANNQAKQIVDDAKAYADKIEAETKADIAKLKADAQKKADKTCEDYIKRRLTVAELDIKKIKLNAKKQVIDEVFEKALKAVSNMKTADYKKLIKGMLDVSAEDGDTIMLAEADKRKITKKFINDYAKEKGIKLNVDKNYGDFNGGFILHSENIDKNMTLDVELKALKEELENQVADMLFNEVK